MSTLRTITVVLLVSLLFGQQPDAQGLTFALFERYVDALRQQSGIPGLALAIVRDGRVVDEWVRGFGVANLQNSTAVDRQTPFAIGGLSQTVAATLILRQCIESGRVDFDDPVRRWSSSYPDGTTTVGQLLSHSGPGGYRYNPDRFSGLTGLAEECGARQYAMLAYEQVLQSVRMVSASPGGDVVPNSGSIVRQIFPTPVLNTFIAVLGRIAVPYRVDGSRRATPNTNYRVLGLTAANGLVTSINDLANFEARLDGGFLLSQQIRNLAWAPRGGGPMGYGWFVQRLPNGKKVVWHFGLEPNAYSSLIIKVPDEGLTLILLANSDGLTAPFERQLESGDVTVSPFARIFFSLLG